MLNVQLELTGQASAGSAYLSLYLEEGIVGAKLTGGGMDEEESCDG